MPKDGYILVAGSIAFDNLYDYEGSFVDGIDTENLDELSVSFGVTNHHVRRGGAGANIAWTLALMDQKVALLAAVGADGKEYRNSLKNRGVDVDGVTLYESGSTPHAVIASDEENHQITLFDSGVEKTNDGWLDPDKVGRPVSLAIVGPWQPAFAMPVFEWCKKNEVPCVFDPGQHVLGYSLAELRNILRMCSGFIVNEYEWSIIRQRSEWSVEEIMEHAPFGVVTQSGDGFDIYEKDSRRRFEACAADKVVNPTGAGDAFRAGLLIGLSKGWSLDEGCRLGAAIASRAVEVEGAQLPTIDKKQLRYRVKQTYGVDVDW